MRHVDVSVVLPVRNGQAFIAEAVQSALDQQGVNVEVLVIDDASTDRTVSIIKEFDARVLLISVEKQLNHIRSTNLGISLAKGAFISILHHDDFYRPGKFAAHLDLHARHPSVGLSYSHQWFVDSSGNRVASLRSPVARRSYVVPGTTELSHLVVQNYINFANGFVPSAVYKAVGRYDERLWVTAEWDMWLRIARHWSVGYLEDPLVCYRLHAQSITHSATRDSNSYHNQLRSVIETLLLDDTLPRSVRSRLPLAVANSHFSMAVLQAMQSQWPGAVKSAAWAATSIAPWRWPHVVKSAALVPRIGARLKLRRSLRN